MIESDLAELYQADSTSIERAVERNRDRFPEHFMIQISPEDARALDVHLGGKRKGTRSRAVRAFTGEGVAMLSSVLDGKRAAQINVAIIKDFARFYQAQHLLPNGVHELEYEKDQRDKGLTSVLEILRDLIAPPRLLQ